MRKVLRRTALGVLGAVVATGLLIAVGAWALSDRTYERGHPPLGVNLAKVAGLDPGARYEMIYGFASHLDPHGDRIEYYCLQLEGDPWLAMAEGDWRRGAFTDEPVMVAAGVGDIDTCFGSAGADAGDRATAYTSSRDRAHSVAATFVSLRTGRVLTVDFAR